MSRSIAAVGSAVFFLLAPCVVAGLVPLLLTGWDAKEVPVIFRVLGILMIAAAVPVLIDAFARFVFEGHGTPAPVAPTDELVVGGLYRYVRNPMYVAVVAAIFGQAFALGQAVLVVYAFVAWASMAAFVHFHEEPALLRRYGRRYEDYRRRVPGWLPRL